MNRHIAIIGCGHVGASLAHTLVAQHLVSELTLIDSKVDKAKGHALDLKDAMIANEAFVAIHANDPEMMLRADILVIAIGPESINSIDRLDEFNQNKAGILAIAKQLNGAAFPGIVINITNPCDVITQILQAESGLPKNRVFGTGTSLDTLRLKRVLSEYLAVSPADVTGYMAGEHGDSQFVAWSSLRVAGRSIESWALTNERKAQIEQQVVFAANEIYYGKGCTEYGIAAMTAQLCRAIFSNSHKLFSVSVFDESLGCYISHPTQLKQSGLGNRLSLTLSETEQTRLAHSADIIRRYAQR